jgi:hypothetical protein
MSERRWEGEIEEVLPAEPSETGPERERPCPYCSARVEGHWLFCPFCDGPLRYPDSDIADPEGEIQRDDTLGQGVRMFLAILGGGGIITALVVSTGALYRDAVFPLVVTLAVILTLVVTSAVWVFRRQRRGSPLRIALQIVILALCLAGGLVGIGVVVMVVVVIIHLVPYMLF